MFRSIFRKPPAIAVDDLDLSAPYIEGLDIRMSGDEPVRIINEAGFVSKVPRTGGPGVTVDTIPGVPAGDVVLRNFYGDNFGYGYLLDVAGMQTRLEWRANEWTVRAKTGRVPLSREAIADLEKTARRIGAYFLGEGVILELSGTRLSVGFRWAESLDNVVRLADTKAVRFTPDGLGGYAYGRASGGTQVRLRPSTNDNSSDEQKIAELIFGRPRILETMRGIGWSAGGRASLPPLIGELVRSAVGDDYTTGFFRLVEKEPRTWPLYRRRTSDAWRGVRRSLLDPFDEPEVSSPSRIRSSGTS